MTSLRMLAIRAIHLEGWAKEKARGTAIEPRAVSYWESGIIGFLNPLARVALQSA